VRQCRTLLRFELGRGLVLWQQAAHAVAVEKMSTQIPDGFSATAAEIRGWLRDAGFRETSLYRLVGKGSNVVWSMVVGVK
jgi:hypothetical protein